MKLNTRRKKKAFKKGLIKYYGIGNGKLKRKDIIALRFLTKNEKVWARRTEGRMTNVFQVNEFDFVAAHSLKQAIRWYLKNTGFSKEMIDEPRKVNLSTEFMYILDDQVTIDERKYCISVTSENHDEEILAMPYWLALRHFHYTFPEIIASKKSWER